MSSPTLLFGARNSPEIFQPQVGQAATSTDLQVRSHRLAPAGAGGLCVFRSIWLSVRHKDIQGSAQIRAYVDDLLVFETSLFAFAAQAAMRSYTTEVGLSVPLLLGGVEVSRLRPQGTWIQVEVAVQAFKPFAIDGLEVEWEQVQRRER